MNDVLQFIGKKLLEKTALNEGGNTHNLPPLVPMWVLKEGYEPIDYRVPEAGEFFFSLLRGERVVEAKDNSGGMRVVLRYVGKEIMEQKLSRLDVPFPEALEPIY